MNRSEFESNFVHLEQKFSSLAPEMELTVRDPELGVEGYVVVWTTLTAVGGPLGRIAKGGTRITPNLSLDEVKQLARTMALKNAAAGLPLGGAKSGLKADPNAPGFEKIYRRFANLVKPVLAENGGSWGGFGFDIGGSPVHPVWICDELKSRRCFTGKSLEMGGTDYDREGIAGLGVAVAAKIALQILNKPVAGAQCAIQGLGAMGAAVFKYFTEMGGEVVAISDPRYGGTYILNRELQDKIRDSVSRMAFEETVASLKNASATKLPLEEVLYHEAPILFPCAVQNVITETNCDRIKASLVVEGANFPSTEAARTLLFKRGITVVPDFIANPGGIIAAFIEMSSTISPEENLRTRKNVIDAKEMTKTRIAENVEKVLTLALELQIEPAITGKYLALNNIFKS